MAGEMRILGLQIRPQGRAPTPEAGKVTLALLSSTDVDWRKTCLARVAGLPAGYTYLAQLMGHDMGSSISLAGIPYQEGNARRHAGRPTRYNLIENPLTLETIYGPGPSMLGHVFNPATRLFRLPPRAILSRVFPPDTKGESGIRALYDERNRDTLMLHELAASWMVFHNLCARQLIAAGWGVGREGEVYAHCRRHAVRVWHGIIRKDLLPRLVHPDLMAAPPPGGRALDETTVLHGLMRACHALPLSSYDLGLSGSHNLEHLMSQGYAPSVAEKSWQIDWQRMFGGTPFLLTGISASLSAKLSVLASTAHGNMGLVAQQDVATATQVGALSLRADEVQKVAQALPKTWAERVTPQALATRFQADFPTCPVRITAEELSHAPLFLPLMIEAQLFGSRGGFGPLGSALLRGAIETTLGRVILAEEDSGPVALPTPETMLDLLTIARERNL